MISTCLKQRVQPVTTEDIPTEETNSVVDCNNQKNPPRINSNNNLNNKTNRLSITIRTQRNSNSSLLTRWRSLLVSSKTTNNNSNNSNPYNVETSTLSPSNKTGIGGGESELDSSKLGSIATNKPHHQLGPHHTSSSLQPIPSSDGRSVGSKEEAAILASLDKQQIKGASFSGRYRPGIYDVWFFGMTTVLGGVYYGWNTALQSGFGSFFISQFLMGFSYIVLIYSLAEVISITSFSGGSYGMARVVLGFYPGFILASIELLEYLSYTADAYQFVGDFLADRWLNDNWKAPMSLFLYLFSMFFLLDGNYWYWNFNTILGILSLGILVIYFFVCLPGSNFEENATLNRESSNPEAIPNWFCGGFAAFLQFIPYTTWGFGGIESAALVTDLIENPRQNLTRGVSRAVLTLFVVMICILFVAVSVPAGGLSKFAQKDFYMDSGWSNVSLNTLNSRWLMMPAQFAMGFGFLVPSSKLFYAMGQSNLLPPWLRLSSPSQNKSDYRRAIMYTLTLSYLLCLLSIYLPSFDITNLPILCAFITYLSDLYAYYRLKTDFNTSERYFKSPFGIIGACIAAVFFILGIIGTLFFQGNFYLILYFAILVTLLSLYYVFYGKFIQTFSDQEQKTLLTLHILAMNKRRRLKKWRKKVFRYFTDILEPWKARFNCLGCNKS